MRPVSPGQSMQSNNATYSCIRCCDRKVKSDKQNPCSACVRHRVQCVVRAPPPPRRRNRRIVDGSSLEDRIKRYESMLQNLRIDPTIIPQAEQRQVNSTADNIMADESPQMPTPASTTSETDRSTTTSQLMQGKERSKFVDK